MKSRIPDVLEGSVAANDGSEKGATPREDTADPPLSPIVHWRAAAPKRLSATSVVMLTVWGDAIIE